MEKGLDRCTETSREQCRALFDVLIYPRVRERERERGQGERKRRIFFGHFLPLLTTKMKMDGMRKKGASKY